MITSDIQSILSQPEGISLEFKVGIVPFSQFQKLILSFANTEGGYLIFGIDDNKQIVGLSEENIAEINGYLDRIKGNEKFSELIKLKSKAFDLEQKSILAVYVSKAKRYIISSGFLYYREGSIIKFLIRDSFLSKNINYDCFSFQKFSVGDLLTKYHNGSLRFITDYINGYQKWDNIDKSRFIESLLMNQPQQALLFDGSDSNTYVLSGMQIIKTLDEFCNDKFSLQSLVLDSFRIEGRKYKELPQTFQYRLLTSKFDVNVIMPGTSNLQRIAVYENIINRDIKYLRDYRKILYPMSYGYIEKDFGYLKGSIRKNLLNLKWGNIEDVFCQLATILFLRENLSNKHLFLIAQESIEIAVDYILEDKTLTEKACNNLTLIKCINYIIDNPSMNDVFKYNSPKQLIYLIYIAITDSHIDVQALEDKWKKVTKNKGKLPDSKVSTILKWVDDMQKA